MIKVEIEEPKDFYREVEQLIHVHYKATPQKGFNNIKDGFAENYPNIYRLFLRIAALGLNK